MDTLKADIRKLQEEIIALRRDFHAHPELGFQEFRSAEKVEEYLRQCGLEPQRVAGTGVTATLEGKEKSPVILLRADMDALPIQEENDIPYKSENKGVMHACGHDAHMAMLLGAAKILSGMKDSLKGTVKFLFQPNEEIAGADILIEQGVMEHPKVDAALGIHIWTPLKSGYIGLKSGAVMATLDVFKIIVKGRGGHTGYPESAVDPILAAADIVSSVQSIQTRKISLMKPTVIMFGRIEGGTKSNIIPDQVVLEGTIRYLYDSNRPGEDNPPKLLDRLVKSVCETHGCGYELEVARENIAVINSQSMVDIVRPAAIQVVGSPDNLVSHASMAGEDFASYAARVPGVFVFLGTGNPEKESDYPHHNPRFNIDEDTMLQGVELYVRGALSYFDFRKGGDAGKGTS
ncbi:MAG: amidohydrolase [Spirochaetales bacterium]|nr:amidohydrolase [Spirochaetales bacterium]